MTLILFAILAAILAAIFSVAFLLAPAEANSSYWGTVSWVAFLFSLNWFFSAAIFGGSASGKVSTPKAGSIFGALPGLNIVVFLYSLLSLTLLLAGSVFDGLQTFHLVGQIIVGSIFLVISLIILLSVSGAVHGSHSEVSKSNMLHEVRRIIRLAKDENDKDTAKEMLIYIQSSMPHPSRLDQILLFEVLSELKEFNNKSSPDLGEILDKIKGA